MFSTTITELLCKAQQLVNKDLSWVAQTLHLSLPMDLNRAKGSLGVLIEKFLGANSGSLPELDFPHLGIELKTIPVDQNYKPLESTYVCTLPLHSIEDSWENSWVKKKLSHVLWVPIGTHPVLTKRIILQPFLWKPTSEDLIILKQDWEEIIELVHTDIEKLTARFGTYLQIRPKAMNNKARTTTVGIFNNIPIIPKGFYLRAKFTQHILQTFINLPEVIKK